MVTIADPATIPGVRPLPSIAEPQPLAATRAGWRGALVRQQAGLGSERLLVRGREQRFWPDDGLIEALAEGGVLEIVVARPVAIDEANAEDALAFLRFLRDCGSEGVQVQWRGAMDAAVPLDLLVHLQPPDALEGCDRAALRRWWAGYRYGACYWRQGPDFVSLRDTRTGREAQRLTLAEPAELDLFAALQQPVRTARRRSAAHRAALAALMDEGLVLELGGWALSLAVRMRRWPVPAMAI